MPDDVGGRFSVLTAVGLLPIAASGADIDALMAGAAFARENALNAHLKKIIPYSMQLCVISSLEKERAWK